MNHPPKLGFIGAGHMAYHMVSGLIHYQKIPPKMIGVSNRTVTKLQRWSQQWHVETFPTNENLIQFADVIFIAVKPKDFPQLADEIRPLLSPHHWVVSLMAAWSLDKVMQNLNFRQVIRIVPNLAVSQGCGVMAAYGPFLGLRKLQPMVAHLGRWIEVEDENLLDPLLVATSAGIGLVIEILDHFADWLQSTGFSADESRELLGLTFEGAGRLAQSYKQTRLEDLVNQVASKRGVTESILQEFRLHEVDRLIRMSLDSGKARLEELATWK